MNIYAALNAAMRDIAKIGIGKTQKNEKQNYRFRGVEQAMNEMSPIMVNHGITVQAQYADLVVTERTNDKGTVMRFVTLKGLFAFCALDGSTVTSEAYGEAMDSGDKAVIKAQSVSFRTALFQLFVVPTMSMDTELDHDEEESDTDAERLEVFREAALQGTDALKKLYEKDRPPSVFWARHSQALKDAAAAADKAGKQ